ncbi:MAG: phosphoglycerate kinase [Candidatus Diapherotrites archaeon]
MRCIDEVDVKNKTIVLRIDINSPVENGKPILSKKIKQHSKTIKELSEKGAKQVVLSHQGRKGDDTFISLEGHAELMSKLIGKRISFCAWDEDYVSEIKELTAGDILFLDNTRFLDYETKENSPEEHAKTELVKKIAPVADYFVLDALAIAHRSHASVVGFTPVLKSFAGPLLKKEMEALNKTNVCEKPRVLILGGSKTKDSIKLMKNMLKHKEVETVLLGGIIGELFLKASGTDLGKKEEWLKEKEFFQFLDLAKELIETHDQQIVYPADVAVEENTQRKEIDVENLPSENMIFDIGERTSNLYEVFIKRAKLIIYNGPMGMYENPRFALGTKRLAQSIVDSEAYSVLGGGDTETAVNELGFDSEEFSHVSMAGKACLKYLSGDKLAGLEALEQNNGAGCIEKPKWMK